MSDLLNTIIKNTESFDVRCAFNTVIQDQAISASYETTEELLESRIDTLENILAGVLTVMVKNTDINIGDIIETIPLNDIEKNLLKRLKA